MVGRLGRSTYNWHLHGGRGEWVSSPSDDIDRFLFFSNKAPKAKNSFRITECMCGEQSKNMFPVPAYFLL